ncbi:MAG TPA: hypothetical protein VD886_12975 [Herpetosiphonaceae bacterium]|nr:hypothetical protein [Herpetosiphonaceae bacterium]
MPDWSPNWTDVRWDHAAANAAVTALNQAAGAIESGNTERITQARAAVEQWSGPHRDTFDDYLKKVLKEGGDLAAAYRKAATDIANASRNATEEQNKRVRDRERWYDERDEELREQRKNHPGKQIPY